LVYIVGQTYAELAGSHYYDLFGFTGNDVPRVFPKEAKRIFCALSKASSLGLISSLHDCSEGGIAVTASEMAFAGGLGMEIFLSEVPYKIKNKDLRNDFVLFSESNSRFIVEVEKRIQKKFESVLKGVPFGLIGCISEKLEFKVYGLDGKVCLRAGIDELREAWKEPLRW